MNFELINAIRSITIVAILLEGSIEDLKVREIRDELWLIGAIPSTLLLVLHYMFTPSEVRYLVLITHVFSIVIGVIIAIVLALLGFMGGGDAKAYMFISVFEPPTLGRIGILPPSLSIIINSIIVSLVITVYIFIRNLKDLRRHRIFKRFEEPILKRIAVLFLAFEEDAKKVKREPWKFFISEDLTTRRKFALTYKIPEKEIVVNNLDDNERILVSPAIPMLVFILAGYVIHLLYGNIMLMMLSRLLGT